MGRSDDQSSRIGKDALERYLRRQGHPAAKVIAMGHLGDATGDDLKSYGYGKPLRVRFEANGQEHDIVMRTMSPDPFGHERHADRVGSLLLDFDMTTTRMTTTRMATTGTLTTTATTAMRMTAITKATTAITRTTMTTTTTRTRMAMPSRPR